MRFKYAKLIITLLVVHSCTAMANDAERIKEFQDRRCRLALPSSEFKWLDNSQIPNTLAAFGDNSGIVFIVLTFKTPDGFVLTKGFTKGFDEGSCQSGMFSKISGEIIKFRNLPCYQVHLRSVKDGSVMTVRAFAANGYLYQLQLIGSILPIENRNKLENIFSAFEFVGMPNLPTPKPPSAEQKAYNFGMQMGRISVYCLIAAVILFVARRLVRKRRRNHNGS